MAARGWPTLAVVGVCPSCERSEPIVSRTLATEQRVARRRGSAAGAGGAAPREKFRFLGCYNEFYNDEINKSCQSNPL